MVRLGIIGTGWILGAHLDALRQLRTLGEDVVVTAIATRDPNRLRGYLGGERVPTQAADSYAAPEVPRFDEIQPVVPALYRTHQELLASGEVDAVLDLTPPFRHHEVALDAIDAGVHVLTEKPLTVSVALGRAMLEAAEQAGVVLAVAEQVRCLDRPRAEREVLASGAVGELRIVEWPALGSPWARSRIVAGTPWRHRRAQAGGGTGLDNGVHTIDWLRFTVGEIDSVQAVGGRFAPERISDDGSQRVAAEVEDYVSAHLRFRNGALGHISLSWLDDEERTLPRYVGSLGSFGGSDESAGRIDLDELNRRYGDEQLGPYARQLLHFTRAVAGSGEPAVPGREGFADLCVCLAIQEAMLTGGWVDVEEVANGRLCEARSAVDLAYLPSLRRRGLA